MRKISKGSRFLSLLLVMAMVMTFLPVSAFAAVGDPSNASTGLSGNINTADTISLPIKILDYEADGMLFEYADSYTQKTAEDFGATWYEDYTELTSLEGSYVNAGNYWSNVGMSLNTSNAYAKYVHMTWAGNTTANWCGNRASIVLGDFNATPLTTDQIRYMVVVFRSNVRNGYFTVGLNRSGLSGAGTEGNYTNNMPVTTENNTNWTYAVLDLENGTLGSNWNKGVAYGAYVGLPIDASNEWMDLAHVAFFPAGHEDQARAFGEYAVTDGSNRGDNMGFSLLFDSRNQNGNTIDHSSRYPDLLDDNGSVARLSTSSGQSIDFSTVTSLGYTLLGTFGEVGIANVGLLESGLSAEGYPVYKQEVVTYIANLLRDSLEISERTNDGWKNYRYVKGTASSVYGNTDLASALRTKINGRMGSYDTASGKDLVGTWEEVNGNIASYYDAAYFLLNSIFVPGSYNELQDDYDYLVLSAGTDSITRDKVYVFDGGFTDSANPSRANRSAVTYNSVNHTIQNDSAAGKTHVTYEVRNNTELTTNLYPFLPITDRNNESGMTQSPYYQDDAVLGGVKYESIDNTLYNRNYGFAMVSEGEFVYHADDELFFEFEGDDDVYLFINGELVMDIGSAHSIDSVRFEVNDYVNAAKAGTLGSPTRNSKLALEEGNTYSFKFYYMERHSYGSNIRINTNIKVTDPSMTTAKTAWQYDTQLDFGSIVDKDNVVEYGFAITNSGKEALYNLTFTDNDIGVTLDPTNGLTVTGSRVSDVNGGTLEAEDLTAVVSHPDYADINVTFADNNALKQFLENLTATGTQAGGGLFIGATVTIRGIGYKLSDAQIAAGVFDNTVLTTATNKNASKTLQGQASMRVFVPSDPMYYEWADHELKVTKDKLITDVLEAARQSGNVLVGKVPNLDTDNVNSIELVTKSGTAISSPYVTIDGSNNLTVKYDTAGSHVFYVKITYNYSGNTVIVPVLVNVTDVQDSVYVLDYGLSVDLTEDGELTKNDTLTVPGRTTDNSILAIGSNGAYSSNEITFDATTERTGDNLPKVTAKYGDFVLGNQKLTFTPDTFLEGFSTTQVAVNVYENSITPSKIDGDLNINKEVEMYKSIITLPANVVYYEDDFPAITYTSNSDEDDVTNTIEPVGSSKDKTQSADQDEQYGHDDTYAGAAEDKNSAGSLTKITIKDSDTVASFKFRGTGFELIGRTNAYDSASLIVTVKDSNEKIVKRIPVITEFDNNNDDGNEEIYQVPVIRVDDLKVGTYTVEISGVPAYTFNNDGSRTAKDTILYVDGLRIFQPIEDSTDRETVNGEEKTGEELYLETEQDAQFIELRDQIVQGRVAVVNYNETDGIKVSTTTSTWTENLNGEQKSYVYNEVNSVTDYLIQGPNNEVYMNGTYDDAALVFYVKETGEGAHSLQIALRTIDEVKFFAGIQDAAKNSTTATVQVGVYANNTYAWTNVVEKNTSSTEQYYVIDYTKCYYDTTKGAYQVVIRVDEGMVSYSSLKLTGLELFSVNGDSTDLYYINGILSKYVENPDGTDDTNTVATASFKENSGIAVASVLAETTDDTATGEYVAVDASTYVNFLSVKEQMASNVLASDLEEPEVTEPEDPETETTEPTEPEVPEPEEDDDKPGKGNSDDKPGKGNSDDKPGKGNPVDKPVKGNPVDKPVKGKGPVYTTPGFKPGEDNCVSDDSSKESREEIIDDLIGLLKSFWGI